MLQTSITTPHLLLTSVDLPTYEAIFAGMPTLSKHLNVSVPETFSEFGIEPYQYTYNKLKNSPNDGAWWLYLFIMSEQQALAGIGGYKGPPNEEGIVEIGYSIYENFQNQGLATEAARGLINQAFNHPDVTIVQAHTLAQKNASVHVLKKCKMEFTNEFDDPVDGLIWQWQLRRSD